MFKGELSCKRCDKKFVVRKPYLMNERKFCSHKCYSLDRVGKYNGENNPTWKGGLIEYRCSECNRIYLNKPSRKETSHYCSRQCKYEIFKRIYRDEGGPNWQGGITPINVRARRLSEYRKWVREVKKRDNYTCRMCSSNKSVEANHITPFRKDKYNYDLSNGITLCKKCHIKTFHKEEKFYHIFKEILNDYMQNPAIAGKI